MVYQNESGIWKNDFQPPSDPRTPSAAEYPDFGKEREDFNKTLQNKIGGNPYEHNPEDLVKIWDKRQSRDHFNNFFKGYLTYNDRRFMNKHQRESWNKEVQRKHAFIQDAGTKEIKKNQKYYDKMMGEFDKQQSVVKSDWDTRMKRSDAVKKQSGLDERQRTKVKAAAVKTAAESKKNKAEILSKRQKFFNNAVAHETVKEPAMVGSSRMKSRKWESGDRLSPSTFENINAHNEALGLPPLQETEVNGKWSYGQARPEAATAPEAPQEALDALAGNPDLLEQFVQYYDYTPEGY